MLVSDFLSDSAARYPEKEFLVWRGRRITYGFMMQKVDALAAGLVGEGLAAGDRVGLCMGNSPEYVLAYFAVLNAGAVVVPVSDQTNGRGLANILNDCQASLLFIDQTVLPSILEVIPEIPSLRRVIVVRKGSFTEKEAEERIDKFPAEHPGFLELGQVLKESKGKAVPHPTHEQDLAMILYTSGTTGSPKGVMLTNRNLVANADSIVTIPSTHLERQDNGRPSVLLLLWELPVDHARKGWRLSSYRTEFCLSERRTRKNGDGKVPQGLRACRPPSQSC